MGCRPLLLAILLLASLSSAQFAAGFANPATSSAAFPSLGAGSSEPVLTDPGKVRVDQSVTFAASSWSGGSSSAALLENRFTWSLSDPLSVHLGLGILDPLHSSGVQPEGATRGATLIPELGLDYRFSENVQFAMRCVAASSRWP
jgi:hypothetical protein